MNYDSLWKDAAIFVQLYKSAFLDSQQLEIKTKFQTCYVAKIYSFSSKQGCFVTNKVLN